MRKLILLVINTLMCAFLFSLAIINYVHIVKNKNLSFSFDFSMLNENTNYKYIVVLLTGLVFFWFAMNLFSSSTKKRLDDDQKNFSHLSSVFEAKKGLIRVNYHKVNGQWQYNENTLLQQLDKCLNPIKKFINKILTFFRVDDRHKLNTIKYWEIDHQKKIMRAGLPVYMPRFRKKTMFIEGNDVHNLAIGTTNSGKTYSLMLQMIETVRMSGECGVFNDPKGELYAHTAQQFKDDGYEVIRLNFVNPEASDDWGVMQYAWNEWKEAHNKYEIELREWKEKEKNLTSSEKAMWLNQRPEPDYSKAIEYITDMASILTHEPHSKSPFWNDSARDVIVGLCAYLMEECIQDKNMSERMINFKSVKLLLDIGEEQLTKEQIKLLNLKSKSILDALLELTRSADSISTMNLKDYADSPDQTRKSIKKVVGTKISLLTMNEQIMKMTSTSSFNLKDLGQKKMVIYLIVHDEKKTYYPLVTLFIKQLYETIINQARGNKGRLPIPVNVMIDEAGNCPAFKDVQSMLTAGRSRGVRFTFLFQDISQIVDLYGKEVAQTIQNNCSNTIYLLGSQPETLKNFSAMCGNRQVWVPARQMYESRALISVDRLAHLNLGEVVVHRQRKSPFITRMIPYDKCKFYCGKNADPNELKPKKESVPWLNPKTILNAQANIF